MVTNNNPLLEPINNHRLKAIPFDKIKTEHFLPAIEEALARAKAHLEEIRKDTSAPTFENTFLDFEGEALDYTTGIFFNLYSAESDSEFKALAQKISPMLAEYGNSVMTDPVVFARVKAIYDNEVANVPAPTMPQDLTDKAALQAAERYRLIRKTYTSFLRNGALLNDEDKKKLKDIDMELSKLSPKFTDNLLSSTNAFELHLTDPADVEGIPASALASAAFTAKQKGKAGGWLFTLQPSSMSPLVTYCKKRANREIMQRAYASRAFNNEFDNQDNIKRTVELRNTRAKLLGFNTHAEYVIKERMAETPETAISFLNRIYDIAYPVATQEVKETIEFARETDGITDFKPWDFGYYANKLKEKLYNYDPEQLRPWFKIENVLDGLFAIANTIYGITLKQVFDVPVYHKDVTTWEVHDKDSSFLGLLYLDLFPRDTKRGGAWMTGFQSQGLYSDGMRPPHIAIVGSLTPSTDDQPSLLRLDEARTIFHEFGHALHGLMSDCTYRSLASPSVMWDFVELPSQIMENWLLEEEALAYFAKHYQTGEPLPQEYLDKVIAAKNFHAGIANISQLRLGMLDFAWHTTDPKEISDVDQFENDAIERFRLFEPIGGANISCAFAHIFAGGYSAGYYSYKWAEALEADAWSLFTEKGVLNPEVAQSFRENILARGNSFHPMELFVAFRGRKPDPDAMLKRDGLI